jgi:DNA-binding NarL/FixJ family response regulator
MAKIRLLIADDHNLVAEAFTKMLNVDFEVVARVSDGRALLELAPKLKPEVVILDLGMPVLNGIDAGEKLKRMLPGLKLIVVTVNEDSAVAAELLRRWASAYLLKKSAGSELMEAIREVMKGRSYVCALMKRKLADRSVQNPQLDAQAALTPRQREVLQLFAEGHTMKEMARILQVSPRTIAFHKYSIMERFSLKTNSELFRLAIKKSVIPPT